MTQKNGSYEGEQHFHYKDADGTTLYSVAKFPNKNFRRYHVKDGEKIWNWQGVEQVPYNLPNIFGQKAVLFVEGEKDVDNLNRNGFKATTIAGGSGAVQSLTKSQPDFWRKHFDGFQAVVILPDNDTEGLRFQNDVAGQIHKNTSAKILTVKLPDLPEKGDVSDFLQKHSVEDLETAINANSVEWEAPEVSIVDSLVKDTPENLNVSGVKTGFEVQRDLNEVYNKILQVVGSGSYSGATYNCKCPGHEDKRASLSITKTEDKILMKCHAGCSIGHLCDQIGVPQHELFRDSKTQLSYVQATAIPARPEELKRASARLLEKEQPKTFDHSLMPPILRDFADDCAKITESDPIIILSTALSALGAHALTKLVVRQPDYFVPLYGNIWNLTIKRSGAFKTTGLNAGAQHLRDLNSALFQQINDTREFLDEALQRGEDEDSMEVQGYQAEIEALQKKRRILPGKASWEACLHRIGDSGGGLWLLSEFGAWLAQLESQHNKGLRQLLTELYDVPNFFEDFTISRGSRVLERPHIGIAAVSTLEFLQGLLTKDDASTGFLARFLLFRPPEVDNVPDALPVNKVRIEDCQSYRLLQGLYSRLDMQTVDTEYKLSQGARDQFCQYHDDLYKRLQASPENLRPSLEPFVKRWSPGAIKASILCQYLINADSREISEQAMVSAISLILYAEESTRYLFSGELGESEQQIKFRKVYEIIQKKGGEVTREWLVCSKVLNGGAKEYDWVLETLQEQGKIIVIPAPGRGKGQTKIQIKTSIEDKDNGESNLNSNGE